MIPAQYQSLHTCVTAIVLPLVAALLMAGMESLVESIGWRLRMVKTGWDLCILAAGAAAGIFASPQIVESWGNGAVILALTSFAVSLICALIIMHIRKTRHDDLTGWHGLGGLIAGGAALVLPFYFAVSL